MERQVSEQSAATRPHVPAAGGGAAAPAPAAAPTATPVAGAPLVSPRRSIKVAWAALTGAHAAVWMAHETGAWRELGLDSELVRVPSSSRVAAAIQAGEIDAGTLDWAFAFQFVAQGGNARQIAAMTNRVIFSVFALPGLTRPADLAGKRWGITRLGSATHTAALLALDQFGLRASDVQFLQLQEITAVLVAMEAGQCDVGLLSRPTSMLATQAGYPELLDLATAGPEYPSIGLAIADRHIADSPELVRATVAGYAQGVARFRQDPERAIAVMGKYLQLEERQVLVDLQQAAAGYLAYPPVLPLAALDRVRDDAAQEDPRVATLGIDAVAVPRFADELQAQGYFAALLAG